MRRCRYLLKISSIWQEKKERSHHSSQERASFAARASTTWFGSDDFHPSALRAFGPPQVCSTHLLQLVGDHGERPEDAVRGAGDGDDPLGAGAL